MTVSHYRELNVWQDATTLVFDLPQRTQRTQRIEEMIFYSSFPRKRESIVMIFLDSRFRGNDENRIIQSLLNQVGLNQVGLEFFVLLCALCDLCGFYPQAPG